MMHCNHYYIVTMVALKAQTNSQLLAFEIRANDILANAAVALTKVAVRLVELVVEVSENKVRYAYE